MWDYIFYLAFIHEKTKTEYTGEESYVYNNFIDSNISWIPYKRCQQIDLQGENEEEAMLRMVENINENVIFGNS